jgi:Phosphate-selective porin O and P
MTAASRGAAVRAGVASLLAVSGLATALPARAAPTDPSAATPASTSTSTPARPATHPQIYPFVFLLQTDAVLSANPGDADARAGDDPPDGSTARLRRLRVGEDVTSGAFRGRVILEATSRAQTTTPLEGGRIPVGGPVRLTEAFAAWRLDRTLQVAVGAQRVPFSLSRQVDEADLRLPERAQILTALAPDYRTGVSITSDLGLLDLRAAFMSADTSVDHRMFTSGYLGAFRLGADPIGPMGTQPWRRLTGHEHAPPADPWYGWWRFSGGVSFLYGTLLGPHTLALGGDAQLQWLRFTVTAEYLGQHAFAGDAQGTWPHQGAVLEPGVFVMPERLELVLRGAWYREPYVLTAIPTDTTDTLAGGAGLMFYAHKAQVRLQAAFELRRTVDALASDSHWAILRATFALE